MHYTSWKYKWLIKNFLVLIINIYGLRTWWLLFWDYLGKSTHAMDMYAAKFKRRDKLTDKSLVTAFQLYYRYGSIKSSWMKAKYKNTKPERTSHSVQKANMFVTVFQSEAILRDAPFLYKVILLYMALKYSPYVNNKIMYVTHCFRSVGFLQNNNT